MENVFFFQTQQIPDDTILFDEFKQQNILYSYFQVDQNHYLFLFSQKSIDINFLYQSVEIIEELDSKERKIRSLRGFFLYGLEIMEKGKDYEILETNLQPFFWRKVKNIIRQNQKGALLEFLFGKDQDHKSDSIGSSFALEELQNQLSSLQQKVLDLEAKLMRVEENSKYPLSELLTRSQASKIDQEVSYTSSERSEQEAIASVKQDDTTLKPSMRSYFQENDTKVNSEIKEADNLESKSLSEGKISLVKPLSNTQQGNISSNQNKPLNEPNFITLGNLSEKEKIEIIQRGFQLNQQGKISLKKYYEGTKTDSLFQLKGYCIKYEAIRKNKLYQQLKP